MGDETEELADQLKKLRKQMEEVRQLILQRTVKQEGEKKNA